ncbi:MAG: hypothetical protein GXP15_08580 [Gammaproteobacteria bacterium]|nr:hypothetical protein [Gammaproteobacteria bacterium]
MHKLRKTRRNAKAMTMVVLIALTAGCAQTSDWLKGRRTAKAVDPIILGAPEAESYLSELYELVNGDPFTQVEIFSDAKSAATLTPDPSSQLRYALVLAAPGHAESNPQEAQSLFRQLLSRTELLTPAEIALATIHLKDVEERLVLDAETRRLRAENTRAATTEQRAIAQRMSTVETENRRLRQQLSDAEQKLEAITLIERSIREQAENDGN